MGPWTAAWIHLSKKTLLDEANKQWRFVSLFIFACFLTISGLRSNSFFFLKQRTGTRSHFARAANVTPHEAVTVSSWLSNVAKHDEMECYIPFMTKFLATAPPPPAYPTPIWPWPTLQCLNKEEDQVWQAWSSRERETGVQKNNNKKIS